MRLNSSEFLSEDLACVVKDVAEWEALGPIEDHPEASTYSGMNGEWRVLVIGEPAKDGRQSIGGTMIAASGVVINMPHDLAKLAYERARAFLKEA